MKDDEISHRRPVRLRVAASGLVAWLIFWAIAFLMISGTVTERLDRPGASLACSAGKRLGTEDGDLVCYMKIPRSLIRLALYGAVGLALLVVMERRGLWPFHGRGPIWRWIEGRPRGWDEFTASPRWMVWELLEAFFALAFYAVILFVGIDGIEWLIRWFF